jgi:hypothetical protein
METKLEHILVNSHKAELITYMGSHPENFDELIKLAIADKHRYSWRAAWLLWGCMSPNDRRIRKYIKRIIDVLPTKMDSQQRELLIVLQRMELNDNHEGYVFDICTKIWQKTSNTPSLRYNAFKLMVKISKKHPDLFKETNYLAKPLYIDLLSSTVRKSIFKMLEDLSH